MAHLHLGLFDSCMHLHLPPTTMSRPVQAVRPLIAKASHQAILPVPGRTSGNNVPHSMHKTRRVWHANVKRYSLPVNVLGGAMYETGLNKAKRFPEFRRVKMTPSKMKDVQKAGGLEAMLVGTCLFVADGQLSRPSKHFTPFGKSLRSMMFAELHKLRAGDAADRRTQQRVDNPDVPRIE